MSQFLNSEHIAKNITICTKVTQQKEQVNKCCITVLCTWYIALIQIQGTLHTYKYILNPDTRDSPIQKCLFLPKKIVISLRCVRSEKLFEFSLVVQSQHCHQPDGLNLQFNSDDRIIRLNKLCYQLLLSWLFFLHLVHLK